MESKILTAPPGELTIVEGKVEYDNRGNGAFEEWWSIGGDRSNKWLKEFDGKNVRITVETV